MGVEAQGDGNRRGLHRKVTRALAGEVLGRQQGGAG